MKLNREICIIAHRAIIERIAQLYSRIMLFADGDLARYIASGYRDITLHINYYVKRCIQIRKYV